MNKIALLAAYAAVAIAAISSSAAQASPVVFSAASATFYQTCCGGPWLPSYMINPSPGLGWAVSTGGITFPSEAATALLTISPSTPVAAGPEYWTITIVQNYGNHHLLGDFSLGYTTDTSPILGTSTYLPFTITGESSLSGATTFTSPGQDQLLALNSTSLTDTYTISLTSVSLSAITGIFLEVYNNSLLPNDGPGNQPSNGNFVVSEFDASVTATPLPAALPLFATGLGAMGLLGWRRKRKAAAIAA